MITKQVKVIGKVQGVYFRASTKNEASDLGLHGWVRNETDGSVLIQVTGETEQIDRFIAWCRKGPLLARVDEVQLSDSTVHHNSGFSIIS